MICWKKLLYRLIALVLLSFQSQVSIAVPVNKNKVIAYNTLAKVNTTLRQKSMDLKPGTVPTEYSSAQVFCSDLVRHLGIGLILSVIIILWLCKLYCGTGKRETILTNNIFQLRRTIRELYGQEKRLMREICLQEQAISIILHDVRSPLAYVLTSARQFNNRLEHLTTEEIREFFSSLLISSERIDRLVNELVQWQLFGNNNNQQLLIENIHLQTFLDEIKDLYEGIVKANNNTLTVNAVQDIYIRTDRSKLSLIFRNLVDNANKHCKDGNILLSGSVSRTRKTAIISVMDTGYGINEECVKEFIQPLTQVPDLHKDKLGHILIKYFIELMGGICSIQSERGGGTTITVELPDI